jgi:mono/diheme cytochrome c family protein
MRSSQTVAAGVASILVCLVATACERPERGGAPTARSAPRPQQPPVRITMDALHKAGGVPPGWKMAPPPGDVAAGRQAFIDFGCHSCHAIKGEQFPASPGEDSIGPELTGMGSHHPPAYFVEAILNPDAVLVEGPGYLSDDNRSRMPAYPDMTVTQLADLVAYLQSLTAGDGGEHAGHAGHGGGIAQLALLTPRPAPPKSDATVFFVQVYDVRDGQLAAFEEWFKREGAAGLLAHDGLAGIDTYVDNTRGGPAVITLMGFRDDDALTRFLNDPGAALLKQTWDSFIGPHGHQVFRSPPVYEVGSLSAAPPRPAAQEPP